MTRLLLCMFALFIVSACGTKGSLECPPGTIEREDGTCLPAPASNLVP